MELCSGHQDIKTGAKGLGVQAPAHLHGSRPGRLEWAEHIHSVTLSDFLGGRVQGALEWYVSRAGVAD